MNKLQTLPQHIGKIMGDDTKMAEKEIHFRQALIDYPENEAGILHLIMMCLACQEKNQECIDVCERILTLLDEKEEISAMCFYLGLRYLSSDREDKAIEQFSKSLEINKVMVAGIELFNIYKKKSDWDNVIKTLDGFECTEKQDKLEKLYHKGFAYYKKKEFENAVDCYNRYLEIDPNNAEIIANLGSMYGELGRLDECIELLVKSLKIEPNNATTYFNLGNNYNLKDDYYMAMHYYLEALKIQPDYPEAYNNMGAIAFTKDGDSKKGIEYLEKALELTSEDNTLRGILYLSLTKINKKLTNFERVDYYKAKYMGLFGYEMTEDDEEEE